MPDVTIKQKQIGNYYIEMRVRTSHDMPYYEVLLNERNGDYYRTDNGNVYHIDDKKNANQCFYRYCSKAKKETRI